MCDRAPSHSNETNHSESSPLAENVLEGPKTCPPPGIPYISWAVRCDLPKITPIRGEYCVGQAPKVVLRWILEHTTRTLATCRVSFARLLDTTMRLAVNTDKPDVRLVIHSGIPKTVESYYQQTGRAGRDGLPAKCVLLFSRADAVKQKR